MSDKKPSEILAEKSAKIRAARDSFSAKLEQLGRARRLLIEKILKRGDQKKIDEIRKSL
jgi:hypothetical protein